jgi:hypothetical protein
MAMKAIIVSDVRSDEGQQPGAVEIRELHGEVRGFAFRCPCGCGFESWLPVNRSDGLGGWDWDGNREAPTLTPSILQSGLPCKWHGFLTAGEFVQC